MWEAEGRLMAQLPEGTLMRRAAFGLARHARRMLGRTAGRRVGLLVGAGDNGGDALWAGVELRRRGVGRHRGAARPGSAPTRPGSPRCAGRAAATVDPDAAGLAALTGADLVLDGIVGISGRGRAARPAAAALVAGVGAGRGAGARRRPAQRRRHRHRRGRRARRSRPPRPSRSARSSPCTCSPRHRCGPVHLVDIGLGP